MSGVAVSTFRAQIQRYIQKVMLGEEIIITSHGQEIARLVPPVDKPQKAKNKLTELGQKCRINDIVSPLDADWKVLK